MSISHFYVPATGQTDAEVRAAALGVILVSTDLAQQPRYINRIPSLPAVVCDHGDEIAVLPEPTTIEAVRIVHDQLLQEHIPTDVARTAETVAATSAAIAAHSTAANPHGITPAAIGAATSADIDARLAQVIDAAPGALDTLNELAAALGDDPNFAGTVTTQLAGKAPTSHTHSYAATSHSHVDADLPAGLARDSEVTSAVSTHAATPHGTPHSHPYSSDTHNHDTAYATTGHTHAATGITGGAIRKTAAQTMTLTAQTAVADMAFTVAANSTYYFAMTLRVTTSTGTSPTTAWGFTGPASPVAVAISSEQDISTSVEVKGLLAAFGNLAAGAQVANTGAEFRGIVQTGATAGTVQLTVARAGTSPSMIIAAGSNGFWLKVA